MDNNIGICNKCNAHQLLSYLTCNHNPNCQGKVITYDEKIKELQAQKVALLDKYGIFGGGIEVNKQFQAINIILEQCGVTE